jgi:signal transduction histidine kinase
MPTPETPPIPDALLRFLAACPALFFLLDRTGLILEAGETTRQIAPGPLAGSHFQSLLVHCNTTWNVESVLRNPGQHLLTLTTPKGSPQSYRFSFAELGDHIICIGAQDATETELLRDTLVETNQELAVRTRELQRSNSVLDRLNDQKNRFLGMAAHDLRVPIGHVLYGVDMLQDTLHNLSEEQAEALAIIHNAGNAMLRILNDLLDIAHIEAGRLSLSLQPGDLAAKIRAIVGQLAPLAASKGMRLDCHCPDSLPETQFDPVRFEQLLTNLLTNAIKYAPPHTQVRICAAATHSSITLSVADQGGGIPLEERDSIFEPFGRGSAKPTAGEKSVGLGLCIARSIARGHGGDLVVTSPPGEGAVFTLTLPQPRPHPDESRSLPSSVSPR